jgi:tetratricopeptide (TPR) repeat protein
MAWRRLAGLVQRSTLACTLLPLLLLAGSSYSAPITVEFDQANRLYEEGKFQEAAGAYAKIVASGSQSPSLYFNLGNAQFKAGHIGDAIVAYRRAEWMNPRDPDVRANLLFARQQVPNPTMKVSRLQRGIGMLTTNEWALLAVVPVWGWFGLLIARQLRPSLKPALRTATLTMGAASLLACAALAIVLGVHHTERIVVVTSPNAVARFGPFVESPNSFTAGDGAELSLRDAKDDWFQVSDGGRAIGWIKTNAVVVVAP